MSPELLQIPGVDLAAVGPEIITAAGGLLILIVGSRAGARSRPLAGMTLAVLAGALVVAAVSMTMPEQLAFDRAVARDGFAGFLKLVFLSAAFLSVVASLPLLDREDLPPTEYLGLMLFAVSGMMLMASAADLMLVFLALETFSLALYILAAFRRRRLDSQEGAMKYFLTGSFASAFFLYGVALVYGGTGSTRLAVVLQYLTGSVGDNPLVLGGVALLLVGLAFKVAAVPFHMWTPDVYQGSPAPVVGFMAAGSKAAGFAVLLRGLVGAFPALVDEWRLPVAVIAVVTMAVGSIVAVAQSNVKRMLAYSAIAHSGFLLIAVAAANERGISGSLFYLGMYTFMIVAAFAVVYAVGRAGEERVSLADYRGLSSRHPFLAGVLALMLLSLAGVPPTGGFWAKFEVFSAGVDAGLIGMVVVGVIASAVAAFFYLRVIVLMYLEEAEEWGPPETTRPATGLVLWVATVVIVAMGVYPTPLLDLARNSTLVF